MPIDPSVLDVERAYSTGDDVSRMTWRQYLFRPLPFALSLLTGTVNSVVFDLLASFEGSQDLPEPLPAIKWLSLASLACGVLSTAVSVYQVYKNSTDRIGRLSEANTSPGGFRKYLLKYLVPGALMVCSGSINAAIAILFRKHELYPIRTTPGIPFIGHASWIAGLSFVAGVANGYCTIRDQFSLAIQEIDAREQPFLDDHVEALPRYQELYPDAP